MVYDYIIVGAGLGGLSSALNLVFNNKKVLVLEKNNLPGGLVSTFKKGRFEFDSTLFHLFNYGNENHIGELKQLFEKYDLDIDTTIVPFNALIKILNKLIARAENNKNDLYKLGILNMLALILHNFPEGIATFMSSYKDMSLGIKLAVAIAFHNIPEGISIAVPIYYATNSKKEALLKTFLSGIAEPIGALIAYIFLSKYITDSLISIILILVGGIMITLAIEVILPKTKKYNLKGWLYLGFLIGVILILFNYFMF